MADYKVIFDKIKKAIYILILLILVIFLIKLLILNGDKIKKAELRPWKIYFEMAENIKEKYSELNKKTELLKKDPVFYESQKDSLDYLVSSIKIKKNLASKYIDSLKLYETWTPEYQENFLNRFLNFINDNKEEEIIVKWGIVSSENKIKSLNDSLKNSLISIDKYKSRLSSLRKELVKKNALLSTLSRNIDSLNNIINDQLNTIKILKQDTSIKGRKIKSLEELVSTKDSLLKKNIGITLTAFDFKPKGVKPRKDETYKWNFFNKLDSIEVSFKITQIGFQPKIDDSLVIVIDYPIKNEVKKGRKIFYEKVSLNKNVKIKYFDSKFDQGFYTVNIIYKNANIDLDDFTIIK